jgi:Tn3 transposase DDE domain-containing protein
LARAISEVGRIAKSLYLLDYYDDESYRRRILNQLTRGERRHGPARAVFHGRKGELRQPYREGQEDQLGLLGLVVNILVLWTTQYMDLALSSLREQGIEIHEEDMARLSPLGHRHIHLLGRYNVALSEDVPREGFRVLRGGPPPAAEGSEDYSA